MKLSIGCPGQQQWKRCLAGVASLYLALNCGIAHAMTSVLIWPIDPVIESDQRAAALWLENHDNKPATLQVRVLGWRQVKGDDVYDEQQERVAGSPPMVVVPPGKRQMIRLTHLTDTPPGIEEPYRVVIDEVPQPADDSQQSADATSMGIHFQMHYSIPLFVDGRGIWTKEDPSKRRDPASATQPVLTWHLEHDGEKRYLVVTNQGQVHARLTQIAFDTQGTHADVERGLLGYVLAGAQMRWMLSKNLTLDEHSKLIATVNGRAGVELGADTVGTRR